MEASVQNYKIQQSTIGLQANPQEKCMHRTSFSLAIFCLLEQIAIFGTYLGLGQYSFSIPVALSVFIGIWFTLRLATVGTAVSFNLYPSFQKAHVAKLFKAAAIVFVGIEIVFLGVFVVFVINSTGYDNDFGTQVNMMYIFWIVGDLPVYSVAMYFTQRLMKMYLDLEPKLGFLSFLCFIS